MDLASLGLVPLDSKPSVDLGSLGLAPLDVSPTAAQPPQPTAPSSASPASLGPLFDGVNALAAARMQNTTAPAMTADNYLSGYGSGFQPPTLPQVDFPLPEPTDNGPFTGMGPQFRDAWRTGTRGDFEITPETVRPGVPIIKGQKDRLRKRHNEWLASSDKWGNYDWEAYHQGLPIPIDTYTIADPEQFERAKLLNELITGEPYIGLKGKEREQEQQKIERYRQQMRDTGFDDPVKWMAHIETHLVAQSMPGRIAESAGRGLTSGVESLFKGTGRVLGDLATELGFENNTRAALGGDAEVIQDARRRAWTEQVQSDLDQRSALGAFGTKAVRTTAETLGQMAPALAAGGTPATYGLLGAQSFNDTYNISRASGMDVPEALALAGTQAAIETVTEVAGAKVAGRAGLVNLESAFGRNAAANLRRAAQKGGVSAMLAVAGGSLGEGAEEAAAEVLGAVRDALSNYPVDMSNLPMSFTVGTLAGLSGHVPAAVDFLANPTRKNADAVNLPKHYTPKELREIRDRTVAAIQEATPEQGDYSPESIAEPSVAPPDVPPADLSSFPPPEDSGQSTPEIVSQPAPESAGSPAQNVPLTGALDTATPPDETSKPTRLMGKPVSFWGSRTDDNAITTEFYESPDGSAFVRIMDDDSGELVGLANYPNLDAAIEAYRTVGPGEPPVDAPQPPAVPPVVPPEIPQVSPKKRLGKKPPEPPTTGAPNEVQTEGREEGRQGEVVPPPQVPAVEPPAVEPAPKKTVGKKRPTITAADFRQQLDAASTSPDEADALYKLVEARAEAAGEKLDDYVGKRIAGVERGPQSGSVALKQQAEGRFGDVLTQVEAVEFPDGFRLPVLRNPSTTQAKELLKNNGEVRGLFNNKTGEVFLWKAGAASHAEVAEQLGLDWKDIVSHSDGRFVTGRENVLETKLNRIRRERADVLAQDYERPRWYSKSRKLIAEKMGGKATGEQVLAMLRKNGAKEEELQWMGLTELLAPGSSVTKQQVLDAIDQGGVRVEEVVKGGDNSTEDQYASAINQLADMGYTVVADVDGGVDYLLTRAGKKFYSNGNGVFASEDGTRLPQDAANLASQINALSFSAIIEDTPDDTKFSQYTLPGGENYRELLLTLPQQESPPADVELQRRVLDVLHKNDSLGFDRNTDVLSAIIRHDDWENRWEVPDPADRAVINKWRSFKKKQQAAREQTFRSSHFDEPNVLAHIRFNERTDADDKKVLFIEEIQSDWHQAGRKKGYAGIRNAKAPQWERNSEDSWSAVSEEGDIGVIYDEGYGYGAYVEGQRIGNYRTLAEAQGAALRAAEIEFEMPVKGAVPDAPFKQSWPILAMKRAIQWAAENGFDRIAWTTGEQQAERYDLSKQVKSIQYAPSNGALLIVGTNGHTILDGTVKNGRITNMPSEYKEFNGKPLEDVVGKEIADRLLNGAPEPGRESVVLSGAGLRVGGEGMRGFYDKILPAETQKFIKRFGAKVGRVATDSGQQHGFDITPAMRESALNEGQPLFQKEGRLPRGEIQFLEDGRAIIRAFEEAQDISTLAHELGHLFRRDLSGDLLKAAEQWAGVTDGKWNRPHEEKFARGFENYLRTGKAPTPKLAEVFRKFKQWLTALYKKLKGSPIDVDITPEMRAVYDSLFLPKTVGKKVAAENKNTDSVEKEPEKPPVDYAKLLKDAGLTVHKTTTNTGLPVWQVGGKTFEYKDILKELGARFYGPTKTWNFYDSDPTNRIGDRLNREGDGGRSVPGDSSPKNVGRDEARKRESERPDEQGTSEDYLEYVQPDTRSLIERGRNFGIPQEVGEGQVEDIGKIARAYDKGKPLFLLGSAPGMGKTFVLGGAIRELRRLGARKFVYVTENADLIEQVKANLADYGLDGVQFVTYAKLRDKKLSVDARDAVLILDEAHNAKNIDTSTAKAVQRLAGSAAFSIYASATPFENVAQAKYLEPTGIFSGVTATHGSGRNARQLNGFPAWAWIYGADVIFLKGAPHPIVRWPRQHDAVTEQQAANEWLRRRGVYSQRPMALPPGKVVSKLTPLDAKDEYVNVYNSVVEAYDFAAEQLAKNDIDVGKINRHRANLLKRILEAAKVDAAIARSKELIADGKQVIVFVNTKADRWIGRYKLSEPYRKENGIKGAAADRVYTYSEMSQMMSEWEYQAGMIRAAAQRGGEKERIPPAPFASEVWMIAQAMNVLGVEYELPSVADLIKGAFPSDIVAEYTGRVSAAKGKSDLDAWKANKKKLLVATMDKGGTGLSYHDPTGTMPDRVQLNINLPWSGTQVEQVAGRLARLGIQRPVGVEWLFANNIAFERQLTITVGSRMRSMGAAVQGVDVEQARRIRDFDFNSPQEAAQAQPTSEQPIAMVDGDATEIEVSGGPPIPAKYAVVELSSLTPSNDYTTGAVRKSTNYPSELQPRNYIAGSDEDLKVHRLAEQKKPGFYISDHPAADNGPPTTTAGGVVINGNGRVMSLQLAASRGPLDWYDNYLGKRLGNYGIAPESIKGMKRPVLVRVVDMDPTSPEALRFAAAGNVSTTQAQSPVKTAESLSRLIDDSVLDSMQIEDDSTFTEAVKGASKAARQFRDLVRKSLPPTSTTTYFNEDGNLTDAGEELMRSMLLLKVIPSDVITQLAATRKQLSNSIEGALPQLLKLRRDYNDSDVGPQLVEALDFLGMFPDIRSKAEVNDALDQKSVFGGQDVEVTPGGRMLIDFLLDTGGKPLIFRKKLISLAREVGQSSNSLFDAEPVDELAARVLDVPLRKGAAFGGKPVRVQRSGSRAADDAETQRGGDDMQGSATGATLQPLPGNQSLTPKSQRQIIADLAKGLGTPIRFGRLLTRKFGGYFMPIPNLIGSKRANDIPVVSHEAGHRLDQMFKLSDNKSIRAELNVLGDPATPGSRSSWTKSKTQAYKRGEGVAEFVRYWLTDPAEAQKLAPSTYLAFEQILDANRDVARVLRQAQEDIRVWRSSEPQARLRSHISSGENPLKSNYGLRDLTRDLVDDLHYVRLASDDAIKAQPGLPAGRNPYILSRNLRGSYGMAETFINQGQVDFKTKDVQIGTSLEDILKPVAGRLNDFRDWIVAKRAQELHKQGRDTGLVDADVQAVAALHDGDATFRKAFADLKGWNDSVLQYAVDAGLVTKDSAKAMRQMNQDYVPFHRMFEVGADEPPSQESGSVGSGLNPGKPGSLKRLKGSTRNIVDPIETMIKNSYAIVTAAEKTAISNAIADFAHLPNMGKWVEKVSGPSEAVRVPLDRIREQLENAGADLTQVPDDLLMMFFQKSTSPAWGENTIRVIRPSGAIEFYRLNRNLHDTFKALDFDDAGKLIRFAAYPAQWLRAGVVLEPGFNIANALRDTFGAAVLSKYGMFPFEATLRGVAALVGNKKLVAEWAASGGRGSIEMDYFDRKKMQQYISRRISKDLTPAERAMVWVKSPLTLLRMMATLSEETTRIGEYQKAYNALLKSGMPEGDARRLAAFEARDRQDFAKGGAKTKFLRHLAAFWNAQLQANVRLAQAFKQRPFETMLKGFAFITLPTLLEQAINWDDDDYWDRPQWERDVFWLIPYSKDDAGHTSFIRIPKPFELGIIFGSIPARMLQWAKTNNPESVKDVPRFLLSQTVPNMAPQSAQLVYEMSAGEQGWSFFRDRPIVPDKFADYPPEMQWDERTSEIAKRAGAAIGVSPMKIDYLIESTTGGLGKVFSGRKTPQERFFTTPLAVSSQSIQDFYDIRKELARERRREKLTGDSDGLGPVMQRRFERDAEKLSELRKKALTADEQTAAKLQDEAYQIAKAAVAEYRRDPQNPTDAAEYATRYAKQAILGENYPSDKPSRLNNESDEDYRDRTEDYQQNVLPERIEQWREERFTSMEWLRKRRDNPIVRQVITDVAKDIPGRPKFRAGELPVKYGQRVRLWMEKYAAAPKLVEELTQ